MANNIKPSKNARIRRSKLPIVFLGFPVNAGYISPTRAHTTDLQQAEPHSISALQDENAFIAPAFLTDRYYVNGLLMGYTLPADMTLNAGKAPYTPYVSMINAVGETELAAALIRGGVRLSYTQVFQTHELQEQCGGMHQFVSQADGVWF
ncbi:hypothetical protein [Gluconobacter sphaericus]|uniref:hypothetical protein n=1 Tax=Gluconobacter sphaericus TaxID=574987 RepID=UPI001B8C43F5|nr:hypothetical protein [Gluconobacter sphaericus]MBS1085724.1 hypothetical protein [Gluconobacter sphaericus]MBS1100035.1 hypothetical protein [Gluconobacter sphaericus]